MANFFQKISGTVNYFSCIFGPRETECMHPIKLHYLLTNIDVVHAHNRCKGNGGHDRLKGRAQQGEIVINRTAN